MNPPIQILNLLNHVREVFPNITIIVIDTYGKWLIMDDNFDAPDFTGKPLNFDIFDEATDSVQLPYIYQSIENED